jgi:putative ABC transport system permease protein
MIRHLLKLVWNRRRANALVAVEMLVSFLVLLGVTTLAVSYASNVRQPVGFEYRNVLRLDVDYRGLRDAAPADGADALETLRPLRPYSRVFED